MGSRLHSQFLATLHADTARDYFSSDGSQIPEDQYGPEYQQDSLHCSLRSKAPTVRMNDCETPTPKQQYP